MSLPYALAASPPMTLGAAMPWTAPSAAVSQQTIASAAGWSGTAGPQSRRSPAPSASSTGVSRYPESRRLHMSRSFQGVGVGAGVACSAPTSSTGADCRPSLDCPAERIEGFAVRTAGPSNSVVPFPGGVKTRPRRSTSERPASAVSEEGFTKQGSLHLGEDRPASGEMLLIPPSPSVKAGLLRRELSRDTLHAGRYSHGGDSAQLSLNHSSHSSPGSLTSGLTSEGTSDSALLAECQAKYPVFNAPLVHEAFCIASNAHAGQSWQDNRRFLSHAVGTAYILADLGLDEVTVAVGLLHGILDHTMMTSETLSELVSTVGIIEMVERVSLLSEVSQLHHHSAYGLDEPVLRKLRAMLLSMADVRVVLVKLAERLHSMRTLSSLDFANQSGLAREALEIFAPLANRLGVWGLKAELEDRAFQTLYPAEHTALTQRVSCGLQAQSITYSLDRLKNAMGEAGIRAEDLSGRPKNLYSVFQKMRKKGYTMDEIYDVKAVRVIVGSKADCYSALREVHKLWEPVPNRLKDYIRHKKKNGYQSLHTVVMGDDGVPFEVQIRTAKMHYIAEHGVAAHWRYKEGGGSIPSASLSSMDDGGMSPDEVMEAHVEFARWLITWELELSDKKCRPSGSPDKDNVLSTLHGQMCQFPQHNKACPFHSLQKGRPDAPGDDSTAPIYCVVVRRSSAGDGSCSDSPIAASRTELIELPAGITTAQLLEDGHIGDPELLAGKEILVNHHIEQVSGATVLRMGDQVELMDALPLVASTCEDPDLPFDLALEPHSSELLGDHDWQSSSADLVDQHRKLFDNLYYQSPATTRNLTAVV
eukprot:CAMPEP_0117649902 /NCGR_PEP_ID=MMETSP0804-20121206/1244_1 /TAXON_ID=1074897 /ORGANISM="Tetraselmis astigmatica, Strain CCMP880" /LENGTH=816 /DNA_ID=CAMNT_0005455719 /DNA_START=1014 /DNA_END=3464 /DNA_ORIENTATION=+